MWSKVLCPLKGSENARVVVRSDCQGSATLQEPYRGEFFCLVLRGVFERSLPPSPLRPKKILRWVLKFDLACMV
jgi:hypothetical protein